MERRKRDGQRRAMELYQTAGFLASLFGTEETDPTARMLINIYPQYWSEEEKDEILADYWTTKFTTEAERYNAWKKTEMDSKAMSSK